MIHAPSGYGSTLNHQGTTGFSHCFHVPGFLGTHFNPQPSHVLIDFSQAISWNPSPPGTVNRLKQHAILVSFLSQPKPRQYNGSYSAGLQCPELPSGQRPVRALSSYLRARWGEMQGTVGDSMRWKRVDCSFHLCSLFSCSISLCVSLFIVLYCLIVWRSFLLSVCLPFMYLHVFT